MWLWESYLPSSQGMPSYALCPVPTSATSVTPVLTVCWKGCKFAVCPPGPSPALHFHHSQTPPPPRPVSEVFPWGLTISLVSARSGPFCPSAVPGLHLGPSSDLTLPWPPLSLVCSGISTRWRCWWQGCQGSRTPGSSVSPAATLPCGIKQITSPFQDPVPFAK